MEIIKSNEQVHKERMEFLEKNYTLLYVWTSNMSNTIHIEIQTNKPKKLFKSYKTLATIEDNELIVYNKDFFENAKKIAEQLNIKILRISFNGYNEGD